MRLLSAREGYKYTAPPLLKLKVAENKLIQTNLV
jgi:hypothetical protein